MARGGRPSISKELEELILRLAHKNPRGVYGKIQGELVKPSIKVSQSTVRNILDRHGIQPVPVRNSSIGWRHLMTHYKEQILACDFFTIDTIWLQTIYVLFFIELGSRRIHFAGVTSNPNQTWITQQARQLVWELHDRGRCLQFLIHDNDCSFRKAFDAVFESEGIYVIHTPFQAPNANAHAERWVRTVREECLDHMLIIHAEHLQRVLIEFSQYYNASRPHHGIDQQMSIPSNIPKNTGFIQRRKVLGGMINDYFRSSDRCLLSTL